MTRTPARYESEQSAADGSAAAVEEPGRGDAEGKGRSQSQLTGSDRHMKACGHPRAVKTMDLLKAKWCDAVLVESFGPTQISSGLVRSSSCDAHVTPSFSLLCVFHYVLHRQT